MVKQHFRFSTSDLLKQNTKAWLLLCLHTGNASLCTAGAAEVPRDMGMGRPGRTTGAELGRPDLQPHAQLAASSPAAASPNSPADHMPYSQQQQWLLTSCTVSSDDGRSGAAL